MRILSRFKALLFPGQSNQSTKVHEVLDLGDFVDEARACGWDVVAALAPDTRGGGGRPMVPLGELRVDGPIGLVLGNEGAGIR